MRLDKPKSDNSLLVANKLSLLRLFFAGFACVATFLAMFSIIVFLKIYGLML